MTVKIYITDICGECCPAGVELCARDSELSSRIADRVLARIEAPRPVRRIKLRTVLVAAALALLFTATAYAAAYFSMNYKRADAPVCGTVSHYSEDGALLNEYKYSYPDTGMIFTFTGDFGESALPEFRAFHLPSEPSLGTTDADGWTQYLSDDGDPAGDAIPYAVEVSCVDADSVLILSGRPTVIKEEDWGCWHVLEVESCYENTPFQYENDCANYILLFEAERGWLVTVKGTAPMEELEHIARELEVRESAEPADARYRVGVGTIDVGRG